MGPIQRGLDTMSSYLISYLGANFPRLFLHPPLFYRRPVGLRFDLGGRATTPQDKDVVLDRATALYEASFAGENTSIVVAQDWRGNEPPPIGLSPLFVFSESHAVGLQRPDGQVEVADPEELEAAPQTLTWVRQPARAFRYELVFEGIANADHADRRPAISSRVYFINPASNVILHMYDDRGLDVIARNKRALDALYHAFNGWLLDYDRARMEQAFEY
jgi:hypothetical protein